MIVSYTVPPIQTAIESAQVFEFDAAAMDIEYVRHLDELIAFSDVVSLHVQQVFPPIFLKNNRFFEHVESSSNSN